MKKPGGILKVGSIFLDRKAVLASPNNTHNLSMMSKTVLCLFTDGFEEIETIVPIDLMRRAGVKVFLSSLKDDASPLTGRCEMRLLPDIVLKTCSEADLKGFDMLFLPGGPGVATMRADGRPADLAVRFAKDASKPRLVAAICAAPLVLKDAGLLEGGRRFTAHYSTWAELPTAIKTERVVEDGPVITSRGAGTAFEFGLALVRRLCGETLAAEVAKSVMA